MSEVYAEARQRGLMSIGMFSRASSLSIKTLRAYHEAGILVPAHVDRFTSYRMYTADQLADAAIVRRLRALDLPLDRVREVVHGRDPELTRRILANHQQAMESRLADTARIVAELQSEVAPATHTPVHVRFEPPRDTVRIAGKVSEADYVEWIGDAFERLTHFLELSEIVPAGPPGALYDPEIAEDGVENIELFIPLAAPVGIPESVREVSLGEVPGALCAVLMHVGNYDSLSDTYQTLGAWVARHAEHSGERVREWYIVGPADVDDPAGYRTEVSWPIKQAHGERQ